ncbi:MAG: hypothetical protein HKN49_09075 [Gammaproteobacteria bacterium]|nr:hypothetical protein [Gammaproteobacteria bacterium]
MRKRCVFLTLAERGDYVIDDELAYRPLRERGWDVEAIPWDRPTDWSLYDMVIIRSTWDYQLRPQQFLQTIREIEASDTCLHNPSDIVSWNLSKTYLRDLDARGVDVVPTVFADSLADGELPQFFERLAAPDLVVKPQIGATASGAYRVSDPIATERLSEIEEYYRQTPLMIQPFISQIVTEGEYSLFYFNGRFSHAIRKLPQENDYRSQEEHGAGIHPVRQPESALLAAGQRAIEAIGTTLLYARVDLVRGNDTGSFQLMELELIEPALYFRMDEQAAQRFAAAVDR